MEKSPMEMATREIKLRISRLKDNIREGQRKLTQYDREYREVSRSWERTYRERGGQVARGEKPSGLDEIPRLEQELSANIEAWQSEKERLDSELQRRYGS